MKTLKITFAAIALLLLLSVAGMAYLATYLDRHRGLLELSASEALGREVRIEDCVSLHWSMTPSIALAGLWIGNPDWASGEYLVHAKDVLLEFDVWQLIQRSLPIAHASESTDGLESVEIFAWERLVEQAQAAIQDGPFGTLDSARENVDNLRVAVRDAGMSEVMLDKRLSSSLSWLLGIDEKFQTQPDLPAALLQVVWLNHWLAGEETGGRYAWRPPPAKQDTQSLILLDEVAWKGLDAEMQEQLLRDRLLDLARLGDSARTPPDQLDLFIAPADVPQEEVVFPTEDPLSRLRHPLDLENTPLFTHEDELADEITEMWIRMRELQVQAHLEAWGKETSTRLITQAEMTRHEDRVEAIRTEMAQLDRREKAVAGSLKQLVSREVDLNRLSFLLDQQIEDASKQQDMVDTGMELARLRLAETLASLEQQVLYLTVLRAQRRLTLYARASKLLQQEVVAAKTARDRFQQQLSRARRTLEIDHLVRDRGWFETNRKQSQERIEQLPEAEQQTWRAYVEILDDLMMMNGLLDEIVLLRQTLEFRIQVEAGEKPQPVAGYDSATDTSAGSEDIAAPGLPGVDNAPLTEFPASDVAVQSVTDVLRRERLGILLEPERFVHQPGFITIARTVLDDPMFDADLVARTFAAIDDYIQRRRLAADKSMHAEGLQAEYASLAMTISPRLVAVEKELPPFMAWDVQQIRERVKPYGELLKRTMAGIRENRVLTREQIAVHQQLRTDLMDLGPRSLEIQIDRSLNAEGLEQAQAGIVQFVDRATSWLFLREPPHLGTFLAAFWLQTLAALLLSGLLIALVAYGRRQIDRALDRRRQVPALRDAVITVGDEAELAKKLRQSERETVKQVEETVLREASGQETDEEETESAAMGEEKANEKGREGMV